MLSEYECYYKLKCGKMGTLKIENISLLWGKNECGGASILSALVGLFCIEHAAKTEIKLEI